MPDYEKLHRQLETDAEFRKKEEQRTLKAISDRYAAGLDTTAQVNYLGKIYQAGGFAPATTSQQNQPSSGTPIVRGYNAPAQDPQQAAQTKYVSDRLREGQYAASSMYDAPLADLQSRIRKILSERQLALETLDDRYTPVLEDLDRSQEHTQRSADRTLARRGLIGSGIAVGTQQQIDAQYAQARRDVELQKQQERAMLERDIADIQEELALRTNQIMRERAAFINSLEPAARREYQELLRHEAQMQLAREQFEHSKEMDWANFGLSESQLQHAKTFDYLNYNIRQQEFAEMIRQFDLNYGLQSESLKQEYQMHLDRITSSEKIAKMQNALGYAQIASNEKLTYADISARQATAAASLAANMEQWKANITGHLADGSMTLNAKETLNTIVNEVSRQVHFNMQGFINSKGTATGYIDTALAHIENSGLPDSYKTSLLASVERTFNEISEMDFSGFDLSDNFMGQGEDKEGW